MMYFLGVLFVALGISLSIALHEVGHLLPAKKFGVKVTQYMVGFGPTIWSRRRGETEFGLKAVPLGGYTRMIGMFPPKPGADPSMLRASSTGRFSQLMDQAREDSMEQVKPGDEDRVFYKLSTPRKLVVMLGGPTMNLVIGVVLLTGIFTLYGFGQLTTRVNSVSQCVQTVPAKGTAPAGCSPSDPQAPANLAGIRPGDRIISLAGQPVSSWDDVRSVTRPNGGKTIEVVLERDGKQLNLTATPIPTDVPRFDDQGNPEVGPDGKILTDRVGFMGFSPSMEIVKQPLTAVPALIGDQVGAMASVVLRIPQKMVGIAQAAFGSGPRDPNGPMSVVGVGRVAGEVADGQLAGVTGLSSGTSRFAFLVSLIASVNIFLFLFNLIPLMPLDGGHVAGALWEGLKRQVARLRGRPNPGYVDVAKALPVTYAMSIGLFGMAALLIYADVVNPIKLGG
jgi:membrane-associated protease RseP (regulator of RpoE activity)